MALVGVTLVALAVSPASAADRVVMQLQWDNQFQFAGYYAALWRGFYADAGLDVVIVPGVAPGGALKNAVDEVVSGRADFGTAGANLLTARDTGKPVVVVAPIFQQSPVAVFSRGDADVSSPADLLRVRMRLYPGSLTSAEVEAMLRAEGLDPRKIESSTDLSFFSVEAISSGKVDAIAGYALDVLWRAAKQGLALRRLRPSAYGVDFYGDTLFTREEVAFGKPDLVQRFRDATLKGWSYALDHSEEITDRIVRDLPRVFPVDDPIVYNLAQADQISRLMFHPTVPVGHSNLNRWAGMHEALKQSGLVSRAFDPTTFLFDDGTARERRTERTIWIVSAAAVASLILVVVVLGFNLAVRRRVVVRTAELRASEARLRDAQRMGRIGSWEHDLTSGALTWSDEIFRMFAIDKGRFGASYEAFLAVIHPDDRDMVDKAYSDSLVGRRPYEIVHRLRMPDGGIKWVQERCETDFDGDGKPLLSRGTVQDITAIKEAQIRLADSLREKDTLLREIHHRVKNNLQIISSLLYFQAQKVNDPADLAAITDGRDRLRAMMLVHEKLYQSADLSRVDFGSYVRSLVRQLAESHAPRDGRIATRVDAGEHTLPLQIATPCGLLVCELVMNAFKYAFPDRRAGEVSVRIAGADGRLAVTVADDGVGLPAGVETDAGGSFGWQLINNLAAQVDGAVAVARGAGTAVTVSFPFREAGA